jgi:hypothetical protein
MPTNGRACTSAFGSLAFSDSQLGEEHSHVVPVTFARQHADRSAIVARIQPSPSVTPLSAFGLPHLRAVALAYRTAMGEGLTDGPAYHRAVAAYLSFGGTPDDAMRDVPGMIAAVATQHGEWF